LTVFKGNFGEKKEAFENNFFVEKFSESPPKIH